MINVWLTKSRFYFQPKIWAVGCLIAGVTICPKRPACASGWFLFQFCSTSQPHASRYVTGHSPICLTAIQCQVIAYSSLIHSLTSCHRYQYHRLDYRRYIDPYKGVSADCLINHRLHYIPNVNVDMLIVVFIILAFLGNIEITGIINLLKRRNKVWGMEDVTINHRSYLDTDEAWECVVSQIKMWM